MSVFPAAHAATIRSDSAYYPEGSTVERRGKVHTLNTVHFRLFHGRASLGYQSNYTHVPAAWLELTSTDQNGRTIVRRCWRFTGGKAHDRAAAAYDQAIGTFLKDYPTTPAATFPTAQGCPENLAVRCALA